VSFHIHINDEAGLWNCQGPFENITLAYAEVNRIIDARGARAWKKVRGEDKWTKKNTSHWIQVVQK